jgi:hypothetical protein
MRTLSSFSLILLNDFLNILLSSIFSFKYYFSLFCSSFFNSSFKLWFLKPQFKSSISFCWLKVCKIYFDWFLIKNIIIPLFLSTIWIYAPMLIDFEYLIHVFEFPTSVHIFRDLLLQFINVRIIWAWHIF